MLGSDYLSANENGISENDYSLVCDDAHRYVSTLMSESIKLVITSPPYNVGKSYEKKTCIADYLDGQRQTIAELVRVLDPGGSICWQVGNYVNRGEVFPLDIFYYDLFKQHGLKLRNRVIWHFGHGLHARKRFSGRYETLLWFTKTEDYTFNLDSVRVPSKYPSKRYFKGDKVGQLSGNPKGKNPSDFWETFPQEWESGVWEIPNVKSNHPEKTAHPCQFPVELVERCVLALTNEGDTVLDPYSGVASSVVAALKHRRLAIGIEQSPEYVSIGRERIRMLNEGNLKVRPIGQPVHVPKATDTAAQVPAEWRGAAGSVY